MPRLSSRPYLNALIAVTLLGGSASAFADETEAAADDAGNEQVSVCGVGNDTIAIPTEAGELPADGTTVVYADRMSAQQGGLSRFEGNVELLRQSRQIYADTVEYNVADETAFIHGNVRLREPDSQVRATEGQVDLRRDDIDLKQAQITNLSRHAHASAERFDSDGEGRSHLKRVTYTTCDPADPAWTLKASSMDMDENTNTGEAYNVVLRFQSVPFFYMPYVNFPLEGRKTGLLAPIVGESSVNGKEYALPFYWNIAPEQDATITPRSLENRGTQLNGEYRYLGNRYAGQFYGERLEDDDIYGDDRSLVSLRHRHGLGYGWSLEGEYAAVSDTSYFDDLGDTQSVTSQTHLERRLDIGYSGSEWLFRGRAQSYQTLSGADPYQRLPQLTLSRQTPQRPNALFYDLEAELVRFAHEEEGRVEGDRFDITQSLSLPLQTTATFLTPTVYARHTSYQLEDEDHYRVTPFYSIDSGIFLERELVIGGTGLIQTLEPRLFYLNVPYVEQDNLPIFDTGENSYSSLSSLFQTNRFSGADRQGDANQLTAALTTRFISQQSGVELFSASIGQITYFEERRVTLSADAADEESVHSDVMMELRAQPTQRFSLSATGRWGEDSDALKSLVSSARYTVDPDRSVGLGYRYTGDANGDPTLEQTDLGLVWKLGGRWQALGRWQYDQLNERDLDLLFGLEYRTCCWAFRGVKRNLLNPSTQEIEHSVMFTLELTGLSRFGGSLDEEVRHSIAGSEANVDY